MSSDGLWRLLLSEASILRHMRYGARIPCWIPLSTLSQQFTNVIVKLSCISCEFVAFGHNLLKPIRKKEILIDQALYFGRVSMKLQEPSLLRLQDSDFLILLLHCVVESVLLAEEPGGSTLHGVEVLSIEFEVESRSRQRG